MLLWSGMTANGVGNPVFIDGHITAMMYVSILCANLKTCTCKLGLEDHFCFQQKNDPKHIVLLTLANFCYTACFVGS